MSDERPVDDTELAWISDHADEIAQYAGEWIAVKVDRVVAHGKRLLDVRDECEALGIDDPFYTKIGDLADKGIPLIMEAT